MATKSYFSPVGDLGPHPWISRADVAFERDKNPLYHAELILEAGHPELDSYKALIDDAVDVAFEAHLKTVKGSTKGWEKQYPYELLTDEAGNETGGIKFTYKQNELIRLKDGTEKHVRIAVYDADDKLIPDAVDEDGNKTPVPVFGGGKGRFRHSLRPIVLTSGKKAGVRMDFSAYQIVEPGEGREQTGGFGSARGPKSKLPADDEGY